jgi:hypothetical protein
MSVIDLDRPDDGVAGRRRRPPYRWGVVAALLVGAVLGGLGTHLWAAQQRQEADGRKVSVVLIAVQTVNGGAVDIITNGDGVVQMTFRATVAVVNAGPGPVEVESLAAERPGVLVAGAARSTSIPPGTSLLVPVGITANCIVHEVVGDARASIARGTLPVTASVRTSGGSVEKVSSISLDTAPWTSQFRAANVECLGS